jgi:hypothetical protein
VVLVDQEGHDRAMEAGAAAPRIQHIEYLAFCHVGYEIALGVGHGDVWCFLWHMVLWTAGLFTSRECPGSAPLTSVVASGSSFVLCLCGWRLWWPPPRRQCELSWSYCYRNFSGLALW